MKKVISLAIVLSFLLQMNIPLISFATNEKEVDSTPDTIINLDEHIKHELINRHNDKNGDGEFSIEELSNVYFLAVDCDDCDVDFSGIEHMTNLSTLYLARTTENMDYAKLSELPLDTLGISGFLNDFSFLESLPRLVELKISLFNDANPFDVISRLTELQSLNIACDCEIDTSKLINLTKLKYLTLQGRREDQQINIYQLANLSEIRYLSLKEMNLSNLNGLNQIANLQELDVDVCQGGSLDTWTISQLNTLKQLTLENYNEDVSWINDITGLNSLALEYNRDGIELSQDFINIINSLNIQNVEICGRVIHKLGSLTADEAVEIPYNTVPILKEILDSNSKLYRSDCELEVYENVNDIEIDENNKKIILTPKKDMRRNERIQLCDGITLELQWDLEGDNAPVQLGKKIKEQLIMDGVDADNNGEITKSELENREIYRLSLSFGYGDNFDLTGIEKVKGLTELDIFISTVNGNIDFSILKEIQNLERLTIDGSFENIQTLDGINKLKTLRLNSYSMNFQLDFNIINNMKDLEELELQGIGSNDANKFSQLTDLNALKKLEIGFTSSSDVNAFSTDTISQFTNIEKLKLNNINPSNLSGLKNLTKLKELSIQASNGIRELVLDIDSLKQLTNIETLAINYTGDVNWLNELPKLKSVILTVNNYGNGDIEASKDFINKIKNINAKVTLRGSFDCFIGNIKTGEERNIEFTENELVKELQDPNSKLYSPNLYTSVFYSSERNDYSYNEETMKANIKIKYVGDDSVNLYATDYAQDGISININFRWRGIVSGDDKTEIEFKDENLKNALLEIANIDGDQAITEQDMVNITNIDLRNRNIKDISGLESAINATYIDLSNNQIKDATIAAAIVTNNQNTYINLSNNEIESIENIKNADLEKLNISGNYINLSEGSKDYQVIKNYMTEKYGPDQSNIDYNLNMYLTWSASNQRSKFKKGDVNGDGKVNAGDYVAVLNYVRKKITLTDEQLKRADANGDGKVNAGDYVTILNIVRGKI